MGFRFKKVFIMKKFLFLLLAVNAVLAAACSSLPDGVQKPQLKITDLTFVTNNNVQGFNVFYTVRHNTPAPLPVENIDIKVYINNKQAAAYSFDTDDMLIPPYHDNKYVQFVPANLLPKVSSESLTLSPMLKLQGKAELDLKIVDDKDKDFLNQHYVYEGLIHAADE